MAHVATRATPAPLSPRLEAARDWARASINRCGTAATARRLGVARETILAFALGAGGIHAGSLALIEQRYAALEPAPEGA